MFRDHYAMHSAAHRGQAAEAVGLLAGAVFGLALSSVRGGMCAIRGMMEAAMWGSASGCHDHAAHGHCRHLVQHHYHCECTPPCGTCRCC
jgi:hypothetical protein